MAMQPVHVNLTVRELIRAWWWCALAMVVLDLIALAVTLVSGHDNLLGLLGLLDLDKERGVSTLFQVLLLLTNSALLLLLGVWGRRKIVDSGPWLFMSAIFAFLALDEFAWIHERTMEPVAALLGRSGFLHFGWVVPYGVAVLLLGIWFIPRVLAIKAGPRKWFVLAAVAYVFGALVMESVGGMRLDAIGGEDFRPEVVYELLTTVEEGFEMVGLILLLRGVLELLQPALTDVRLRLQP